MTFSVIYTFSGASDGSHPSYGPLRLDPVGNLYGTTLDGGDLSCPTGGFGCGVVFQMDRAGKERVLYSFTDGIDGDLSYGGVIRDSQGNLFGTTEFGGSSRYGTVFSLSPVGAYSAVYGFGVGAGGTQPGAGVVRDGNGDLYGTTALGGDLNCDNGFGCGVVFEIGPSGNETVLHTFAGGPTDGQDPQSNLLRDGAGNLYGAARSGGASGDGVIFKLDPSGNETVLHSFAGGTDGISPDAGLIEDLDGNLYGVTASGGVGNNGVVFKLDPSGNETILYSFHGSKDGGEPCGALLLDAEGNLYGTACQGGDDLEPTLCELGCGVVFKVTPAGEETVLHTFVGSGDGAGPNSGLVPRKMPDGSHELYGTAVEGGNLSCLNGAGYGCGTIYKLSFPPGAEFNSN